MYKQLEFETRRLEGSKPQQSTGPQHLASQAQRLPLQCLSPSPPLIIVMVCLTSLAVFPGN